jgi:membrane-bound lytic murein transglycosylase B
MVSAGSDPPKKRIRKTVDLPVLLCMLGCAAGAQGCNRRTHPQSRRTRKSVAECAGNALAWRSTSARIASGGGVPAHLLSRLQSKHDPPATIHRSSVNAQDGVTFWYILVEKHDRKKVSAVAMWAILMPDLHWVHEGPPI